MSLVTIAALAGGCGRQTVPATRPIEVDHVGAVRQQVEHHDYSSIARLIDDLESDDSAVRFYAIYTLEAATGQRQGYDYFADVSQRQQAIARWRAWLHEQESGGPARAGTATQR